MIFRSYLGVLIISIGSFSTADAIDMSTQSADDKVNIEK